MISIIKTTKNFYRYQKERFPIIILGLSFLPAILSSGAIIGVSVNAQFILIALIASLTYLLHVRIVDEYRDFDHDLIHHKERLLSKGEITLKELKYVDLLAVGIFLLITAFSSQLAFLCALVILFYSYLAQKEFFLGSRIRKHFFIYNAINLIQMLLLQILIYILASRFFVLSNILIIHFLFTATGTIIFEFLRKVKNPGTDGTGEDTYTWFLGLKNALWVYLVLAILNMLLFIKILLLIEQPAKNWVWFMSALTIAVLGSWVIHYNKKEERTNQLMQLMFIIMYAGFNILIFLNI